jgi:hypothetical protein
MTEESIEFEINRIVVSDPPVSTQDAVSKIVMLIQEVCKTGTLRDQVPCPVPEQVKHYADLIEKLTQRLAETTHDRLNFLIQAAKAIKNSADKELNAQAEWDRITTVPHRRGKSTSVSVFGPSLRPSTPSIAMPPPPPQAPQFVEDDGPVHYREAKSYGGGSRSRSNIRSSYKRSINKSVGKKRKRFISRKY